MISVLWLRILHVTKGLIICHLVGSSVMMIFWSNMVVGFHELNGENWELRFQRWFQLTHVRGRGHGKCGCCVCHLTIMIRCHKGPWFFFALFFFLSIGLAGANGGFFFALIFFSLYWFCRSQWRDCPRWHVPPVRMAAWAQHRALSSSAMAVQASHQ